MLNAKLRELADKIQNSELRSKVTDFLENPTFSLDGKLYSGPSFDVSPGGLAHHHTYEGGYVEHVVATWKIASAPLADYLDHISLATSELVRRNFPVELIHIVAAHYGGYGPIKPRTVEALVVHLADNTDSQLNGQVLDAAWYLTRKATGEGMAKLTSKEAFEIVNSKAAEGWSGVEKAVEKINQERALQKT